MNLDELRQALTDARSADEVHIWYALATDPPWPEVHSAYWALLSDEERARCNRFLFDKDRRQFLLARALVRTMLSCHAPVAPNAWVFETSTHGKPHIAAHFDLPHLEFNHSHADSLVACAVSCGHAVGVDVESLDRHVNPSVARYCLSTIELEQFEQANPQDQQTLLLRQWTLKEAYSKALGLGLSLRFVDISFSWDTHGLPTLTDHVSRDTDLTQWQFRQWLLEDRHFLAVAVRHPADQPCRFIVRRSLPQLPGSPPPA